MAFFYFEPGVSCLFRSCHCKSREGGRGGGECGNGYQFYYFYKTHLHITNIEKSGIANMSTVGS